MSGLEISDREPLRPRRCYLAASCGILQYPRLVVIYHPPQSCCWLKAHLDRYAGSEARLSP